MQIPGYFLVLKKFNYAKTNNTQMVARPDPGDRIDHPKHLYFQ